MAENLLKRLLRGAARRTLRYTQSSERRPVAKRDYDQYDCSFPYLNALFTEIIGESGGILRPSYTWGVL